MPRSLAIRNARIWTADPTRPWARSIAIRDGVVRAIDDERAAALADTVIDAENRVVTPGLIDVHTHFIMGGESLTRLDLSTIDSREAFEAAITKRHAELPDEEWLHAFGWSQERWGGRMPDKTWLRAAGDRPAVAYRADAHVCLVNDAVLRLCDLSKEPDDGRIDRDDRGRATGMMYEGAAWRIINPVIPASSAETRQSALLAAQAHAHSLGLTTTGSMEYGSDVTEIYQPLRDRLTIRFRITLLDRTMPIDFRLGESFRNDNLLAVVGYKTFLDGTFGSRTARMLEPWSDDPGNRGMWCELAASGELLEWIDAVASRGFQPALHAIGDEAARLALDAIDSINEKDIRPRIEHAQQLADDDISRFRGRIASMQPLHRAEDGAFAERRVGLDRIAGTFAFRRLKKAGAILAFGSDWPIVSLNPLAGIRAAVTGLTVDNRPFRPDDNLSVEETLRAYTIDAAYALRFEEQVGSLEAGKRGDLVMFDRDPFSADWSDKMPRIVMTIANGQIVHDAATTVEAPV